MSGQSEIPTLIKKVHHVAYRCIDAKQTVDWYEKHLGMRFILAIAEDEVPSTKEPDPYMHVFLDAGQGNVLAFFELPTRPAMDRDRNTPEWVQHLALEVDSVDTLLADQGETASGRHRGARPDRSHDLQVDLFLRSERTPLGAGRQHSERRNDEQARSSKVRDAGRMVADQACTEACCLDAPRRWDGINCAMKS